MPPTSNSASTPGSTPTPTTPSTSIPGASSTPTPNPTSSMAMTSNQPATADSASRRGPSRLRLAEARPGAAGVNALFYGEPGTGKTEMSRAPAADKGLRAFQVRSADDDGDGLSRQGRLSAHLLAQRLLSRRRDTLPEPVDF